ncbi:MAG: cytochrome c [Polyangiaceae bacterium]
MKPTLLVIGLVGATVLGGCRGDTSREAPIVPIRNMYNQPKYSMQGESEFFADHRTMRMPPEGVVSREEEWDETIATGRLDDDSGYILTIPENVLEQAGGMAALEKRGQDRFGVYCTPCHDHTGSGNGMIVKRGLMHPPTFHQDRLRHAPDGQIFATISNGIRNMPAYGPQVPVRDRWAIVSYVRALQISQAPLAETKQ